MRPLIRILAVAILFQLTPGVAELADDALHWVRAGHTEHAAQHAGEHEGPGAEHGCTGVFHTCGCHQSAHFVTHEIRPSVPSASLRSLADAKPADRPCEGVRSALERPPRA